METKAGVKTTELWAMLVPVLSTLLVGVAAIFGDLAQRFPDVGWIALVAGMIVPVSIYIQSRGKVKSAGATAAAALALEAMRQVSAATAKPALPPAPFDARGFTSASEVPTNPSTPVTPPFPTPRSGP